MNYDARIEVPDEREGATPFDPSAEVGEDERRARRRMWLIGAIALAAIVALWFFLHRGDTAGQAGQSNQAPLVTVAAPGRATIAGTITGNGSLAARREMPVGVAGEGGQVAQVLVEPGQWVRAGQVLAVIDRSVQVQQQASSAAQIQVAQADLRLAQANYDRALQLVERGFISKADIDRLRATRDAAAARVRVAGAQLGELQARTRRLNIVSPAAGLVLERKVEPGQVVGSGSGVLFRIAKGGEMELKAMIGEVDFAKLAMGGMAKVTPVGSEKTFEGQIWQLSPVIDPQTRQGIARIALSYAPELRPGGFASAVISSGAVVAPLLPDSALLSDARGSYVFIVDKNNKVQRRDVKTGMVSDSGVAIASGLDGSERVVLRSGGFLSPGESVNPRPAQP
ncbi:MAG: efflux RND transporter periplasmic adaptor subunit [Novosphingobium sp.]